MKNNLLPKLLILALVAFGSCGEKGLDESGNNGGGTSIDTTTTVPTDTTTTTPTDTITTAPSDTTTVPSDTTTIPSDTTTVPSDTTTIPSDTTATGDSDYQIYEGEELQFTLTGVGAPDDLIPADAVVKNFVDDYGAKLDDENGVSTLLQNSINSLSTSGGGIIYFPKGTYYIGSVELKSNVHLQFEAGSLVRPDYPGGPAKRIYIFALSEGNGQTENVSICGVNGRFKIEITENTQDAYAIGITSIKNFLIENIDIYDIVTPFPMLTFSPNGAQNADIFGPTNGTIRNMAAYNCHYGYGLVQVQCGRRLYFENLHGVGGVTLRLETGEKKMNENQFGGVFDIMARTVSCDNGNAALMIGPHSMHNGVVQIDGVKANSCGFAVRTEGGYISDKYDPDMGLDGGSYGEGSFVKNVEATFGMNAQIKWKHFQYLPFALKNSVGAQYDDYYIESPAIAAYLYSDALPVVKIGKVESHGFINTPVISKPATE